MTGIYLVGMPRSGTTFVQTLIATSDDVYSLPETQVFEAGYDLFHPKPSLRSIVMSNLRIWKRLRHIGLNRGFIATSDISCIMKFHRAMESEAKSHQKSFYLEKSPIHLKYVERISFVNSDCRFVFVLRDPVMNISSYVKALETWEVPSNTKSQSAAIARWFQDTALSLLLCKKLNGLLVRYDALIDRHHAEDEISKMERFLGIKISRSEATLKKTASKLVLSDETWKSNNLHHGVSNFRSTDHSRLSPEIKTQVELVVAEINELISRVESS